MMRILCFGIVLLTHLQVFSQANVDSARHLWFDQTQPDSVRVRAVQYMIWNGYFFSDADSADYFARQSYDVAVANDLDKYTSTALHLMAMLANNRGEYKEALDMHQRSLELREEIGDTSMLINTLQALGNIYLDQGDYEKMNEYWARAMSMAKAQRDTNLMSNMLINEGVITSVQGDLVSAQEILLRALEMKLNLDDKESAATIYVNLGQIHSQLGNDAKALDYFDMGLRIAEEIDNKSLISPFLSNIGRIYQIQKEYSKALEYFNRSRDIAQFMGESTMEAWALRSIGLIYNKIGKPEEALTNLELSLYMSEEAKYEQGVSAALFSLGLFYKEGKDLSKALEYFNRSLEVYERIGSAHGKIISLLEIGEIYRQSGDFQKSIKSCQKGYDLAREGDLLPNQKTACECLFESYKSMGYVGRALEYHELMFSLSDSLREDETSKKLQQMEFEKKIQADSAKRVEEALMVELSHQEEIHEKDQMRNWSMAGGLLALLLAGGFYSRYRYIKKAKAIIEQQKKQVEQSEKYKEQFLANMSHELRTPMHAISGMTKILQRNEHSEFQTPYLKAIRTSSDNLVVILNDVLDMSKIEAGKLQIESVPMSPSTIVESVVDLLKYKAEEKGIELTYQTGSGVPDLIIGDPTRLSQILTNLAGNGIKFTEKGTVDIHLTVSENKLKFKVSDTGIGIPEDKLPQIFRMFEQSDKSINRRFGGTGLGLSISQQLAELMGGEIEVESEVGNGSTFILTLPVNEVDESSTSHLPSEAKLEEKAASLAGIRILIAEDNAFNQMIARDDLNYYIQDVQIDIVENGALAVEKYRTVEYDIILMDAQMPEMDGMAATARIRELEQEKGSGERIPIIAMTASLLRSEIDQYLGSGMDGYIPKPYQLEELIGTIHKEFRKKEY